ncbi:CHAP domain-containing protein [Superficieibacter sp. HKU1]|uniref:CHAP domain-containing protein n=1 Tax=Superficieibacter sp. HKU1 TaxID=3031919 RepID=UPI0023E19CD2|nr:CHAP domain-containing protein [Superficieibacter sp. HKU1]WES66968.1 CHAP domain-containing protein [Superficieibacter sp. HKU1]
MVWDKRAAGNYAKANAHANSIRKCAEYTRKAIAAGGINIGNTFHAKDYGPFLETAGFRPVGTYESPKAGDVVVIQPYEGGNPSGHMAIYDGQNWYSDFKQRDMWGGPGYRTAQPAYKIYRKE